MGINILKSTNQEVEKYKRELKIIQTQIQSFAINWVNKQKRINEK